MDRSIRLAGVIRESIVDGPGIRMVIFGQGCPHRCEGCQNPETHSMDGGYLSNIDNLAACMEENPLLYGVTFSGGDPFVQAPAFAMLGAEAHRLGLNVVTYTGYTMEELLAGLESHKGWRELLLQTDTLVDGRFDISRKSLMIRFRGSTNQRLFDARESVLRGRPVEKEDF